MLQHGQLGNRIHGIHNNFYYIMSQCEVDIDMCVTLELKNNLCEVVNTFFSVKVSLGGGEEQER